MSNTLTQRFSTQHGPQRSYSSDNSSPSFHRMSSSSSIKSHAKRPSLTNWLNRTGSSSKLGNKAPQPVQVSEPMVVRGLDAFDQQLRSGVLGSGATVVATPQEALHRVPGVHLEPYAEEEDDEDADADNTPSLNDYELGRKPIPAAVKYDEAELPSPPESPERIVPSLPEFTQSQPNLSTPTSKPPCPTRIPPPPPTFRPSNKQASTRASYDKFPAVPTQLHVPAPSSQPPFSAILLSPAAPIDRSKIIVHIETETQVYRTTINSVTSRPSHLAAYVEQALNMSPVTPTKSEDDNSIYSEDASVFHRFLASEGVLSASSCNLKLFLDRPSSPYKHILAYLRTPIASPPVLPRSACWTPEIDGGISMLELMELRDEALYLGLQELFALCTDQLRLHLTEQSKKHARGWSTSEASRYSGGSSAGRSEFSERAQMVTPQSMDTLCSKRRSRSLTRPQHSSHSRDGSGDGSNNTIKKSSHSRNESQVSARWI